MCRIFHPKFSTRVAAARNHSNYSTVAHSPYLHHHAYVCVEKNITDFAGGCAPSGFSFIFSRWMRDAANTVFVTIISWLR